MRGLTTSKLLRPLLLALLAGIFLAMFANTREAGAVPVDRTWTGGGANNNWTTAANWDSGPPVAGDTLIFPAVAARKTNVNNFPAGTSFGALEFTGGGYSVTGNAVVVTSHTVSFGTNSIGLAIGGAGTMEVETTGDLTLSGSNTYTGATIVRTGGILRVLNSAALGAAVAGTTLHGGGTLVLGDGVEIDQEGLSFGAGGTPIIRSPGMAAWNGNIVLSGVIVDFEVVGTLTLGGTISGPNTSTLRKAGPGLLILSSSNTYDGGTLILEGTVRAGKLGSTMLPTNVQPGATLELGNGADVLGERIDIEGSGVDGNGALRAVGTTATAGNVYLDGETRIGVNTALVLPNGLKESDTDASLTKVGPGNLFYNGAGEFIGGVTVAEGTMTVGAILGVDVLVLDDGLLRGSGAVADLDVQGGGEVRPGTGGGTGILAVNQDLGLAPVARLIFDIDGPAVGTEYSQLDVTGSVNLAGATLAIDLDYTPTVGDSFTIIQNAGADAVIGTFAALPEGATFTIDGVIFTISYKGPGGTGNDVVVRVTGFVTSDLSVEIAASPSPVQAGGLLTYSITVRNAGPQAASNAQVTFGVPGNTTFVSVTPNTGWTCTQPAILGTGNVSCGISTFPSGGVATFTVVVRVGGSATGSIAASAAVTSASGDAATGNNSAALATNIGPADPRPFKIRIPMVARD